MNRKSFIGGALASVAMSQLPWSAKGSSAFQRDFSLTGTYLRYNIPELRRPTHVLYVSDSHLWRTDEREEPYRRFSDRMAKAYNRTQHFMTKEATNPEEAFEATLAYGVEIHADLLILGGDIFSFPSEAAIEWAIDKLEASGLPYVYTSGNHDWHYEGMEGSVSDLRAQWSATRLQALHQGGDPLMSYRDINGVRFIVLDNSTYEITEQQLEFFRIHTESGIPCFLAVHIPLYTPGRSLGFGCGHPDWGWDNDRNHEIERRERWPKSGHTQTTMAFHETAFSTPNLLGILAGHVHHPSIDLYHGLPQVVAGANATGAHIHLELV